MANCYRYSCLPFSMAMLVATLRGGKSKFALGGLRPADQRPIRYFNELFHIMAFFFSSRHKLESMFQLRFIFYLMIPFAL